MIYKRMGRRPVVQRHNRLVQALLGDHTYKKLWQVAEKERVSVSSFIRFVLEDHLEKIKEE